MKTTGKVLIALGTGLAAGAIAGILMAPKKGSETRNLLRRKGDKLIEDLKDNIKHRIDEKDNQFTKLKDDVREKVNGLNKKIQEVI